MHNLQIYTDLAIMQPGVAILSLLTTRVSKENLEEEINVEFIFTAVQDYCVERTFGGKRFVKGRKAILQECVLPLYLVQEESKLCTPAYPWTSKKMLKSRFSPLALSSFVEERLGCR